MLLTNMRQFGNFEVVLLFSEHDFTVPGHFRKKYPECDIHLYTDNRDNKSYIPSIRPYLLWQYLKGDPAREQETYFYIDSDVIFREWPNIVRHSDFSAKQVVGSDCSGYLNLDYLLKCERGEAIAQNMARICGITVEQMKGVPGIGAHLILTQPTAEFWRRSYNDSNAIYEYFRPVNSNVQKWTAEMWAQLWGWVREGYEIITDKELDFCRPTDDITEWDKVKIMHNAGVTGSGELFFKGKYDTTSPFNDDLSHIRRDKVSYRYVEALQNVVH